MRSGFVYSLLVSLVEDDWILMSASAFSLVMKYHMSLMASGIPLRWH